MECSMGYSMDCSVDQCDEQNDICTRCWYLNISCQLQTDSLFHHYGLELVDIF